MSWAFHMAASVMAAAATPDAATWAYERVTPYCECGYALPCFSTRPTEQPEYVQCENSRCGRVVTVRLWRRQQPSAAR